MKYLRWLLFPFSLLYGLVVVLRNLCYDAGIFKSQGFDVPIISVGNLDVGGAGKTPMTEYLIRLLKPQYQLATLSRGYGRETKGYIQASATSTAAEIGDEPAQLKHKFPNITMAVCEDRVKGAGLLQKDHQLIILDDAYQHRAIIPGYSLLLFDYHQLKSINLLLPAGNRRELFYGRKRANILIVTKCPAEMALQEQENLKNKLGPADYQEVFFTGIAYQQLQNGQGETADINIDEATTVFLLTGIANPQPMYAYIAQSKPQIIHHKYPDHHRFSLKNIAKLADDFNACKANKKIIITTEKDMQRLGEQELLPLIKQLPFYTLPIGVAFLNNSEQQFDQLIAEYVRQDTAHRSLH
jgi:tetraacyldisaccharide 4'-kinase